MLTEYIERAMEKAHYEILDDGQYYGEIPGFQGVLAVGDSLEGCRNELKSVLESWIVVKLSHRDSMPIVDGLQLSAEFKKTA